MATSTTVSKEAFISLSDANKVMLLQYKDVVNQKLRKLLIGAMNLIIMVLGAAVTKSMAGSVLRGVNGFVDWIASDASTDFYRILFVVLIVLLAASTYFTVREILAMRKNVMKMGLDVRPWRRVSDKKLLVWVNEYCQESRKARPDEPSSN